MLTVVDFQPEQIINETLDSLGYAGDRARRHHKGENSATSRCTPLMRSLFPINASAGKEAKTLCIGASILLKYVHWWCITLNIAWRLSGANWLVRKLLPDV